MAANWRGRAQQVLLLCALALCVVAMHHVSMAKHSPGDAMVHAMPTAQVDTGAGEHHPDMPDGAHNLLHLCLAVVCAFVALLLTFLAFSQRFTVDAAASPRGSPVPGRPPDRRGRVILTSLCVLRT